MDLKIRKASLEDINTISKIYALSWKEAYRGIVPQKYLDELKVDFWVPSFKNGIKDNVLTTQIIFEDEVPVGCIAYGKGREDKFSNFGEIVSIYLLPKHFRKGYGQRLLQVAISDMRKDGYVNFYLWVLKDNIRARNFYEVNGFVCNNDECICEIMNKELVDVRYILNK